MKWIITKEPGFVLIPGLNFYTHLLPKSWNCRWTDAY